MPRPNHATQCGNRALSERAAACDALRERRRVGVATANHDGDLFTRRAHIGARGQRGESGCASGLGGVSQIAQSLDLPHATVYRLLKTLAQKEWIVQDDKTYRLSLRLAELFRGAGASAEAALAEQVAPLLQRLVNETGETAHFAALDGDRVVYLAKVDSPHPIRMFSQVGWRGGQVRGALSVAGPTARIGNPAALAKILKAAVKAFAQ
ncbi:helix-turn-helix domain-containing protein [uncultured Paraburkholderia sp.]|uniref:IclR family transcriptional regulator n=1 Tax=uncultured Paraburkholderia sp. TaxID=1822466 RepID=UPI002592CE3F|nr:helix-turn-helix domain-containing protein [uncultured Paraburkholderia sp.]